MWRVIAAAGITLALGVSIMGWRQLTAAQKTYEPFRSAPDKCLWYRVAAGAYVVGVVAFLATAATTDGGRDWPTGMSMDVRTGAVMLLMAVAAFPWVALVWTLHKAIRHTCLVGDAPEM